MNNKILIAAGILGILCILLISGCTNNTSNKSPGTSPEIKTPPAAETGVQAGNETPAGENAQETETKPENTTVSGEQAGNKTAPEPKERANQNVTAEQTGNVTRNVTGNETENKTVNSDNKNVAGNGKKLTPAEEPFNPILNCVSSKELTVGNNNSYDYTGCELMVNNEEYYFYSRGYTFKITSMYPGNNLEVSQFKSARGDPLSAKDNEIFNYNLACYEGTKAGPCMH